jgi:23S rRNA pseudouridine2605 synthase
MAKKKSTKPSDPKPQPAEAEVAANPEIELPQAAITGLIGDETGGNAMAALEPEIEARSETELEAEDGPEPETKSEQGEKEPVAEDSEHVFIPKPHPPANLERLQKILAKAGVASRRKAEELIEQGRVQVNGKIVTELGTKADTGRDHIRVDGKLLQGAERLRYFVLNKPRGFVTTVKDPEGRPTVMQFFEKMRERLYPVGRLDYMSEGLLVVTNDGELANRLTRAAAGVEKTYLVKVAGQPTEAELDLLRGGVAIERGKPGTERVRTSPARVRQVRQGDNPWYEVVLIEGRNRELRKMFEEIGHFVEKIRRVGYGPLVLDREPGELRELQLEEVEALRKAAEGKLRTPKAKEVRRRNAADAGKLPTVAPRATGPRPSRPFAAKSFEQRPAAGAKDYRPKRSFNEGGESGSNRIRPVRPADEESRPRRPAGRDFGSPRHTGFRPSARPVWQEDDRPASGPERFAAGSSGERRPSTAKPSGDRPLPGRRAFDAKPPASRTYGEKPAYNKPASGKPAWSRPAAPDRPFAKRPPAPRREEEDFEASGPRKPSHLRIEPIQPDERPSRPVAPRAYSGRPQPNRPGADRPDRSGSQPAPNRPFHGEGGLARPFTTSSGKPREGGARPSSKPGAPTDRSSSVGWKSGAPTDRSSSAGRRPGNFSKPAGRPFGSAPNRGFESKSAGPAKRPFRRDESGGSFGSRPPRPTSGSSYRPADSRPPAKSGWKPKPSYGGPGKPGGASRSKPRPGSSAKSGYKGKPGGGPKRTGSPGGKKR